MLTERQKKLLQIIVEVYIKEAQPIASGFLAKKMGSKVSSATIRNEMLELEKMGYLAQPYTSAGRIPTEKAYSLFIDEKIIKGHFQKSISENQLMPMKKKCGTDRETIKEIAKKIAEKIDAAVIVAFGENDNYYTGLSNLFSQPEFKNQAAVVNISELIEKFDIIIKKIYHEVENETKIFVGHEGHFSASCSFVAARAGRNLIGILGPLRMDYVKSFQLIKEAARLIKE